MEKSKGGIILWIFIVILFVVGISELFSGNFVFALVVLLMAAILFPKTGKFLSDKYHFNLTKNIKVVFIIVLSIIGGIASPKSQNIDQVAEKANNTSNSVSQTANVETEAPAPKTTTTTTTQTQTSTPIQVKQTDNQNVPPVSSETISQKNAVRAAKSYLDYTAFSHDGLVAQLEYAKFSHADAVYGADNSGANWNEQAAKAAQSYLDYTAFSHDGLVAQLEYAKFTQAQAEFGANAVGL